MPEGIALEDQQTTINYGRTEEGCEIWTSDRTTMTKLDRLCQEAPENYRVKEIGKDRQGALLCKVYYIRDKGLLSFRTGKKRELTEEQRMKMTEHLRRRN